MRRSLRPDLPEDQHAGTATCRPGRSRLLCLVAAASCLVVLGIGVRARLGLGDIDDKSVYYATSAVRWSTWPTLQKLRENPGALTAYCERDPECHWRAQIRLATLANYPAASAVIRFFRWTLQETPRPCRRIALSYERGLLFLHGAVYVLLLGFVASDRSREGLSTVWLLSMLLAGTLVSRVLEMHSVARALDVLLGGVHGSQTLAHYAPRNALGIVFLMQSAAFLAGRMRWWWALVVVGALLHLAQSTVLLVAFAGALVLQLVLGREGRGRLGLHLAGLVAFALGTYFIVRGIGVDVPAAGTSLAKVVRAFRSPEVRAIGAVFLGCLAAAVAVRGRAPVWLRTAAFFASVSGLLFALTLASAATRALEPDQLFHRILGILSPVLRAPLFLLAAWALRRGLHSCRSGARSLASASAVVVLLVLGGTLAFRSAHVAEAWEIAKRNPAVVEREICAFLKGKDLSRRGLTMLEPTDEVTFHLRIVGELEGAPRFRRSAPAPFATP